MTPCRKHPAGAFFYTRYLNLNSKKHKIWNSARIVRLDTHGQVCIYKPGKAPVSFILTGKKRKSGQKKMEREKKQAIAGHTRHSVNDKNRKGMINGGLAQTEKGKNVEKKFQKTLFYLLQKGKEIVYNPAVVCLGMKW